MVSHLPGPTRSTTQLSRRSQPSNYPYVSMRTWIGAMLLLPVVGLLLGAITTGIGRGILEVYSQVSARSFGDLFELLTGVVFSLINVLAVAASATTTGALIGLYSGGAAALMVLLLACGNACISLPLRPVAMVALAIAGAIGAWYGVTATNTTGMEALLTYVAGGMIFGLLAAQSIVPRPPRAKRDYASRQRKSDYVQITARP